MSRKFLVLLSAWMLVGVVLHPLKALAPQAPMLGVVHNQGEIVPTAQWVKPVGETLEYHGRPVDIALSPDGQTLYLKDNLGFVVVDARNWKIRQELKFPTSGGSLHGIAVSANGEKVYASNAQSQVFVAKRDQSGMLTIAETITLPGRDEQGKPSPSYPCGIALASNGKYAYVCLSRNNTLAKVDLTNGKVEKEVAVGIAPWDVTLSSDGNTAYVSNWGGRRAKQGEPTASSAGTEVPIDSRGVAVSGTVSKVDLVQMKEIGQVETGLHASDLVLSPDGKRLYVANANSDTVSVIDTLAWKVVEQILVRPDSRLPYGSAPMGLALSPDGKTLYVTNGGNNAVGVIGLSVDNMSKVRGFIPTGWYPGAVMLRNNRLYIVNTKGRGSRHLKEKEKGWHVYWYLGSVQNVEIPDFETLQGYTQRVHKNAQVPQILRAFEKSSSSKKPVPVPERVGEPSVFDYVVYIIKENRTYDQVFGDMPKGNGDPSLCIFPRKITPNHHALAEQFVLLDNFYCNGVNSADGHSWATEGNVTDYMEKSFGGFTRSYPFGDDPLAFSSSGFFWDKVLAKGLSFVNYGEMDYTEPVPNSAFPDIYKDYFEKLGKIKYTHKIGNDKLRRYSHPDYPGWNMRIPDVVRADVFLKDLKEREAKGTFPNFAIVYLPNDHTGGDVSAKSYLADNDLALGRVVEGISKSKYWAKTCIFVVEDDPQNGFDHVDGHRSPCLVISPYTKRGALVSKFYNQTSVLHTMGRILGVEPMNQMDALAPLMSDCFTNKPDFRPYTALPNSYSLFDKSNAMDEAKRRSRLFGELVKQVRYDRPDSGNDDALNRVLWHGVKGENTPYPAHLAGAHGKGLKALGLRLDKRVEKDDD